MEYKKLSDELKKEFGTKVYKLSLQSGCTCPNRDGKISFGGCSFCSEGGSGDFAAPLLHIDEQILLAKEKVDSKFSKKASASERKYIAYFQSYTNTYGDTNELKKIFLQAINHDEIVAVSIGTRPDCLSNEMVCMLSDLNKIKPIWIELGLQTTNEESARKFGRGYKLPVFEYAYKRLKEAGLTVIVHVILGLPGETEKDMLGTVKYLSKLQPTLDGIKLQLLHVLKGTRLASQYEEAPFHILTLDEYCSLIVKCLKLLPKETIVHRITGDGPKSLLIAPLWSADKKRVLNALTKCIKES